MSLDDKKYTLDNEPISANELIAAAIEINQEYGASLINQTSVAARILRENGHEVGEREY